MTSLVILAEEAAPREQGSLWIILFPLLIIFTLYYFMDSPRRKETARREKMLKEMKKNDRVATIGGILGSVVNVSTDGKEVTLKVDDNTRIKFRRSAIAEVFGDEPADPAAKSS
ncbi:MAG: preprotein translocase subunit YajC [Planctomycetes bacterium]|nr:preprotein translocase subunit YajC [Planctomycetota bacterium]